jgi:hypothetical protein
LKARICQSSASFGMVNHETRAQSMDTDEGTVETTETSVSSPRRPLSVVEEVAAYVDEDATVSAGKAVTPKPQSTTPLESDHQPPSAVASDATSTRSLPVLNVSRPQTPGDGADNVPSPSVTVPPSPARSRHSVAEDNVTSREARRQAARRSAVDVCP